MNTIAHEFGHALGLWHEQTRVDRHEVLTIVDEIIKADMEDNFDMDDPYNTTYEGLPYDMGSVMHYGADVGLLYQNYCTRRASAIGAWAMPRMVR